MRLIKCHIENFGLLHNTDIDFLKGLSVMYNGNGTGKTTLASFIEAMLYGIGDTRKQNLDENPRKKYAPWQGGLYGGTLTAEIGKRTYTIERSFGTKAADDTFRLTNASNGRESDDYSENIGEEIFGIDRDGFLRTVYLSEKNISGKNENKSISAKLSDLVGADGDVGGVDDALKMLEKRRQFYYKKNRTGEIANADARIREIRAELDRIDRLAQELPEKRTQLAELRAEEERLTKLAESQNELLFRLHGESAQRSREEEYTAMLARLEREKAELAEEAGFFAHGVPTASDIDRARDAHAESKRIRAEVMSSSDDGEYIALRRFFSKGTDFTEIAEIEAAARTHSELTSRSLTIGSGRDAKSAEMRRLFPDGAPSEQEIKRAESGGAGGKKRLSVLMLIAAALGGIALIAGLAAAIYTIAIAGAGLLVIAAILMLIPRKNKELSAFIAKYGADTSLSEKEALSKIKRDTERCELLRKERESEKEELEAQISALDGRILAFLEKFPVTDSASYGEAVQRIKLEYSKYYALGVGEERQASGKLEKLKRGEALENTAREFISLFPTVTNEPFDEIRSHLSAYAAKRDAVDRLNRECDRYALKYGVTGRQQEKPDTDESTVKITINELSQKLSEVKEKRTLLENEINRISAETDRRDETEARLAEGRALLERYTESYNTVIKTQELLKEACDSITAKYLGKTKEKFEEYAEKINGRPGEFALNTNFEFAKTEKGVAHIADSYSRGLRDLYGIAMRFALIDALYDNEQPFIILDDPFISLDDENTERAKAVLKTLAAGKQIIYFTCSKSRNI